MAMLTSFVNQLLILGAEALRLVEIGMLRWNVLIREVAPDGNQRLTGMVLFQ